MIDKAFQAGIHGFVAKTESEGDLLIAIEALSRGETFFPFQFSADHEHDSGDHVRAFITDREREVIRLLTQGKSNKDVAAILHISQRTAENHRAQIMRKLRLNSFSDLVRYAIRTGMIDPEKP